MKAVAVFPGTKEVKVIEQEEPQITQPDQVKLRMLEVGICGTDKEICSFSYGTPPQGSEYLVIGHEGLGQVVEVGPAVRTLRSGDLVVPIVRRPCPHPECRACRAERQDFCSTGDFTERGIKGRHGFMAEFVVDHERYMTFVPPDLRDVAVLVEPLTIGEKAYAQVALIQSRLPWLDPDAPAEAPGRGLIAMVLGVGPVGLLGAMMLVAAGVETYVFSRGQPPDPRITAVESIGATYLSQETLSAERRAALMNNIDLVYEAVGASSLAFQVLNVLKANSVFVFTGVPGRTAPSEFDTDLLMRNIVLKNTVVLGTVNAGRDAFEAAIRDVGIFVKRWPETVRSLITRYPVEKAPELLLGRAGGIKNVITFDA